MLPRVVSRVASGGGPGASAVPTLPVLPRRHSPARICQGAGVPAETPAREVAVLDVRTLAGLASAPWGAGMLQRHCVLGMMQLHKWDPR